MANAEEHASRVRDEGDVLSKLRHPYIVRFCEAVEFGDNAGFLMEPVYAVKAENKIETLGQRLRKEGRLHVDLLQRFGEDLLEVLKYLEDQGYSHRDIKPDNMAVGMIGRGDLLHLVLFDFSLSRTPPDNVEAGTKAYLDPFLPVRKRWDLAGLQGGALGIESGLGRKHLSPEECSVLDKVAERVGQTMHILGEASEVFGLIHADIHQWNYLFHRGNVHLIDFDTSGWGYFLYDMAVTFSTLLNHPELPALRTAFLRGYRKVRPLAIEQEACIDTFVAARIFGHTQWLAAHIGEPAFGDKAAVRVAQQLDVLRNWLDQ